MRRLASLRVRITAVAVLVVGLALVAGAVILVHAQRRSLERNIESETRFRSGDIADLVRAGTFDSEIPAPHGDEYLIQVVQGDGVVVASSKNLRDEPRISMITPTPAQPVVSTTVDRLPRGDSSFRIVARRVATDQGTFTVYVARGLESVNTSAESLGGLLLVGLPVLLVLVGSVTWVVTGRALRPVEAIRKQVDTIGMRELHRRVPEPNSGDEISRLAHAMNAMLTRLDEAAARQHRFVADAGHELRSPLTAMRAQLEVDLAHPGRADWPQTARDVLDDTIRVQRLVGDLLASASPAALPRDAAHREVVDLDEIVLAEARRLRSRVPCSVDTGGVSGAQLRANPDQMVSAVRNLLENAGRHAATTVTVTLYERGDAVVLRVADDGPGIPAGEETRIFDRFTRLDDARARDTGGAGLGLAITQGVAEAHGGRVVVENVPGAQFTMTLPLAHARG